MTPEEVADIVLDEANFAWKHPFPVLVPLPKKYAQTADDLDSIMAILRENQVVEKAVVDSAEGVPRYNHLRNCWFIRVQTKPLKEVVS